MKLKLAVILLCLLLVGCGKKNDTNESSDSQIESEVPQEDITESPTPTETVYVPTVTKPTYEVHTEVTGEPSPYMEIAKIINDNPNIMMHICRYIENSGPWDFYTNPADEIAPLKDWFLDGKYEAYFEDMNKWFDECQELRGCPPGTPIEDEILVKDFIQHEVIDYITYNQYVKKHGAPPPRDYLPNGLYPDEIRAGMKYTLNCTYDFYYVEDVADMYITMYHDGVHIFDIILDLSPITRRIQGISAERVYE